MSQALVPDNALLRAFVFERDAGAFDQLAQRHAGMVLGVCQAVLGNGADAEDAAQAVFLTLLTKARSLVNHPTLGAWLHQVAWHVAVRSRRTRANRARDEREAAQMNTTIVGGGSSVPADLLHEALLGLPDRYRLPLVLHHLEGYTQEEAARMLDCKVGTVSGRLTRGRHLLAGRLRKLGVTAGVAAVTGALASATASAAPIGLMAAINTMATTALAGQVAGASRYGLKEYYRHNALADAFFAAQIFQLELHKLMEAGIHSLKGLKKAASSCRFASW